MARMSCSHFFVAWLVHTPFVCVIALLVHLRQVHPLVCVVALLVHLRQVHPFVCVALLVHFLLWQAAKPSGDKCTN